MKHVHWCECWQCTQCKHLYMMQGAKVHLDTPSITFAGANVFAHAHGIDSAIENQRNHIRNQLTEENTVEIKE